MMFRVDLVSKMETVHRPDDIKLPQGYTWELVEAERARWDIADHMVPVASVSGLCTAWGTINSVRMLRKQSA